MMKFGGDERFISRHSWKIFHSRLVFFFRCLLVIFISVKKREEMRKKIRSYDFIKKYFLFTANMSQMFNEMRIFSFTASQRRLVMKIYRFADSVILVLRLKKVVAVCRDHHDDEKMSLAVESFQIYE